MKENWNVLISEDSNPHFLPRHTSLFTAINRNELVIMGGTNYNNEQAAYDRRKVWVFDIHKKTIEELSRLDNELAFATSLSGNPCTKIEENKIMGLATKGFDCFCIFEYEKGKSDIKIIDEFSHNP